MPLLSELVDRWKCHCPVAASVNRNSLPVVAASVGVASIAGSEVVELLNLMTWMVSHAGRERLPVAAGERHLHRHGAL